MSKIAVLDDDESWGLAIQRFFRQDFEVVIFKKISVFLQTSSGYDLVIIDFSIPTSNYEVDMDGCQLITHLKTTLVNPPVLVLATGLISKNDLKLGEEICPAADAFLAKDAGLETILKQVKHLLALKTKATFFQILE